MPASETPQHALLKRLALCWAQGQGFRVGATEVALPQLRVRLDAAACRPAKRGSAALPGAGIAGVTAIFECKQGRADFLRDSRCSERIGCRLRVLHEQLALYEASMRVHLPSLRESDALFPEFDGFRFEAAGFAPYDHLRKQVRRLSGQLHAQTKFADLLRWRAAHLHYVVAEEGVACVHELPSGWGLLVRRDAELELRAPAGWRDISEENALQLLLRIAMSGTRAVHRELRRAEEAGGPARL
jgi:hypothetical protein